MYLSCIGITNDGWYAAQCAQVPEAITQGRTIEEVKENLADAIDLILETKKERTIKAARSEWGKFIYRKVNVL